MSDESPNAMNYDMGDLIRSLSLSSGQTKDVVESDATVPPTEEELAAIEELAEKAAHLQDELRAAVGTKQRELKALKSQLKDRLLHHGLDEVNIAGRPPIELSVTKSRKPTRKNITAVMVEVDPENGKKRALNLWNKIPQTKSHSISIPDPSPDDTEAPY